MVNKDNSKVVLQYQLSEKTFDVKLYNINVELDSIDVIAKLHYGILLVDSAELINKCEKYN